MSFQSPLVFLLACRPSPAQFAWMSAMARQSRFIGNGVARLARALRRFGLKGVVKRVAYYGCTHDWVLGLADIQILGLPEFSSGTGEAPPDDYLCLLASPADLDSILLCSPPADRGKLRALFQEFFASGFHCAIARHRDAVIGYNWAFTGRYTITLDDYRRLTARVDLQPGTVFTGNAYVRPEYRGRGVIRQLKHVLFSHCPTGTRFYTAISELNHSSLRANLHVGFEKLAILRFARTPFGNHLYFRAGDGQRWENVGHAASAIQIDGREVRPGR